MKLRITAIILLLSLLCIPVAAAQEAPTQIHTVEQLREMALDPQGSYVLMADLDMSGEDWLPLDFSGSFDGNGHAILNLTLNSTGLQKPESYDGNRKSYETAYAGLFGTLTDATVTNLKLINVRAVLETDEPCFLAGIAGYALNSTVSGCTVTGSLELRAHDRIFGVGGIVGYGSGYISDCTAEVTLITVDTDAHTKDEQFLGGIYATGFLDVTNCRVELDGYISEHGYVHSGGLVGMYMDYPYGKTRQGTVSGNDVKGKITFFEDNSSRRAYCKAFIGENLVDWCSVTDNTEQFQRDERTDYTVELRPEMCPEPEYGQTVIAATCTEYGYTIYQCYACGYCYADSYTLLEHTVADWVTVEAATAQQEGLSEGNCTGCGITLQREDPRLEEVPATSEETAVQTIPAPEDTEPGTGPVSQPEEAEQQEDVILKGCAWAVGILSALALLTLPGLFRRRR